MEYLRKPPTVFEAAGILRNDLYALNWSSSDYILALSAIVFNPTFWNIVARAGRALIQIVKEGEGRLNGRVTKTVLPRFLLWPSVEYRNKTLTRLFGGRNRLACYVLAIIIFVLGLVRDYLFYQAIRTQPQSVFLGLYPAFAAVVGTICIVTGQILVLSSMWKLGITGTYLGDYFGILMEERVTSFPFNVTDHPMYNGSAFTFWGTALRERSVGGLVLAELVFLVYRIAGHYFEGPFTTMIYAKAAQDKKLKTL